MSGIEPTQEQGIRITIPTEVTLIEERFKKVWQHGVGDKAVFKDVSLGWFAWFQGSYEMLHIGPANPGLKLKKARIIIEQDPD